MEQNEDLAVNDVPSNFGKLQTVELRACWPDEARHFTPWLATPDALAILGQALGLELEFVAKEVPADRYSADILARDQTTGFLVVIENQLDKTDHKHFGQVLTYAAVLDAKTVVWIAQKFGDEHLKVVQWLNELTKGELALFGVELQVWRIGNSAPAPRFDVVCSPNEIVRQAKEAVESEEFSETRKLQLAFWNAVRTSLEQTGKFTSLRSPRPQTWFDVALGNANIRLQLFANTDDKKVGVKLYMGHRVAAQALRQLEPMRPQIEQEVGGALDWDPHPEKQDRVIRLVRSGDIADQATWPELIKWVTSTTVAFKHAFAPRVAQLQFTPMVSPEAEHVD